MSWIYIDKVTEDMQGACTCMHIHAPEMSSLRDEEQRKVPHLQRKRSSSNTLSPKPSTYTYKTLRLPDLPSDKIWWAARVEQFPGVDLLEELEKAQEWSGAHKVKNAKIFFRNWLAKAKPTIRDWREGLSPDEIRSRIAV